jgi:hypothetical protein
MLFLDKCKYLVICLSTLAVTLLLYDIGVRRLTRFLFGMRPRRCEAKKISHRS